jgi:acyl-coenzyme A thioesterase PaaI-like protein
VLSEFELKRWTTEFDKSGSPNSRYGRFDCETVLNEGKKLDSTTQFGDDYTSFLHYSSERTSEVGASSWIPRRDDLLVGDGTIAPVVLAFLVDSTAGVVCGAAARPGWIVTTDLHFRVISNTWKGTVRADATVVRASKAGVLAQVVAVDEGDGERVMAVGSVNHAHIELATPIDVPVEMPIGVRYGAYAAHTTKSPLSDHLKMRKAGTGVEIDVTGLAVNPLNILHGAFHAALAVEVAQSTFGGELSDLMTRFVSSVRNGPAVAVPELVEGSGDRGTVRVGVHEQARPDRTASVSWVGLVRSL